VGDLREERMWFEPPCRPRKLPYVKVFDETHGGSLAFMEGEEFKPLRAGGDLGRKECGLSPRVGPENCPMRKSEHMGLLCAYGGIGI